MVGMHPALKFCAAFAAGTLLGLAATLVAVMWAPMPGVVENGSWQTSLAAGSEAADPWTRAQVAVHGLFALPRSETLYFNATRDSQGDRLVGTCRYRIRGADPDARWWSITAYGADDFLIASRAHLYAVSKTDVARATNGDFAILVGGEPPRGARASWIPAGTGPFALALRLFNPGATMALDPADAALPVIDRVSCP
jgi:hypothetical protein